LLVQLWHKLNQHQLLGLALVLVLLAQVLLVPVAQLVLA
jgi:hypothetical protein